jgi:hypothetical protein
MRRARRRLQPNTFPFMAVLLCAMGALILMLLVLDRRAKLVAQAKAQAAMHGMEEQAAESARQKAEREAEWQRRQTELHRYLLGQEQQVLGQLDTVQAKQAEVDQQLAAGQGQQVRLLQMLDTEKTRLEHQKGELQVRQAALAQAQEKTGKAQAELTKLAAELAQFELALANLQKLRAKQQQSFSIVPYKGNRGDNRKPHYLECVAGGVVFHPDRLVLVGDDFSPLHINEELRRRIKARAQDASTAEQGKRPYLFVLVRPDGLGSYYALNSALADLKVDLGYELIDQDWALDFSEGKAGPQGEAVALAAPPPPNMVGPGKVVQGFHAGAGADPAWPGAPPLPPGSGGVPQPPWPGSPGSGHGGSPGTGGSVPGKGSGSTGSQGPGPGNGPSAPGGGGPFAPGGGPFVPGGGFPGSGNNAPAGSGPIIPYGGGLAIAKNGPVGLGGGPSGFAPGGGSWAPGSAGAGSGAGTSQGGGPSPEGSGTASGKGSSPGSGTGQGGAPSPGAGSNRTPGAGGAGPGGAGPGGLTFAPGGSQGAGNGSSITGSGFAPGSGSPAAGGSGTGMSGGTAGPGGGTSGAGGAGPGGGGNSSGGAGAGSSTTPGSGGSPGQAAGGKPGSPGGPPGNGVSGSGGPPDSGASGPSGGVPGNGPGSPPGAAPGVGASEPAPPSLSSPVPIASANGPKKALPKQPVAPLRVVGNRDWNITLTCSPQGAVLLITQQQFALSVLQTTHQGEHPLRKAVRELIAHKQATVRPGEPPYRPILCFEVPPDGLRCYWAAADVLGDLQLPMIRHNINPYEPKLEDYYRK